MTGSEVSIRNSTNVTTRDAEKANGTGSQLDSRIINLPTHPLLLDCTRRAPLERRAQFAHLAAQMFRFQA